MALADSKLRDVLEPGAFTIPDAFTAARRSLDVLDERYKALRQLTMDGNRVARARNHRAVELVDLANADDLPKTTADLVAPVAAAQAEYDAAALAASLLASARETAEARLRGVIVKGADAFVVDHLRPAHAEVMTAARKAAAKLAGVDLDNLDTVLSGPAPVQAAYREAKELAARYERLRAAREALAKLGGHGISEFVELTGHPTRRLPGNPVARLVAIAESRIAWLPTFAEEAAAQREDRDRISTENRLPTGRKPARWQTPPIGATSDHMRP